MREKLFLVLLALVLLCSSVSATTMTDITERGSEVPSVKNLTGEWKSSCAVFNWDIASDKNYIVQTSSNISKLVVDVNTGLGEIVLCTLPAGSTVTAYVYRVDQNADGHFKNLLPDSNVTLNPGTEVQAAQYFVFNLFVGLAAVVVIIFMLMVLLFVLPALGIKFPKLGG